MVRVEKSRQQLSLFERRPEKGSTEWSAFDSVRGDKVDTYTVRQPRTVHVPVRYTKPHYQQPFILKGILKGAHR